MFSLQDNVPSVYMEESRDFQLLLRLIDLTNRGIKFDIDSMISLTNPMKIKSEFLNLYATKVGFFPKRSIDENTLRYILSAFPYIIKNKGNKQGIQQAVATILKAEKHPLAVEDIDVVIKTMEDNNPVYTIIIYVPIELTYNKVALEELLAYVIPTGFDVVIITATRTDEITIAEITSEDTLDRFYANPVKTSGARSQYDYNSQSDNVKKKLIGAYDTSEVVSQT